MGNRIRNVATSVTAVLIFLCPFPTFAQQDEKLQASDLSIRAGNLLAPKAFRAAAQKVLPVIVRIETIGGVSAANDPGQLRQGNGPASGLILSSDGYIVSSTFHFQPKPPVITVITPDGKRHVARLLGRDETRKICLLKIDGVKNLPTVQFAPKTNLRVGQWAISIGVGYGGAEPAISSGIISATNRIAGRAVQTDANISPANYGGPLVDIDGRVIGVCVPLHPPSSHAGSGAQWYDSGIGFAVPLDNADQLLASLRQGRVIRHGFLGIAAGNDTVQAGVIIAKVQQGSPAAQAGLLEGDVLLSIDDTPVRDAMHLKSLLNRHVAGDRLRLAYQRDGKKQKIEIVLATRREKAN